MTELSVRPVSSAAERRTFLTFPYRIFRGDPLWVPPLLPDLAKRIDPQRGVFFQRGGQAELYIAWRGRTPVGTICAAEDREANAIRGQRECVFGFFHFIDDPDVFDALLGAARAWAARHGLAHLTGPFNLDYEDGYGVLLEGRDRPPALLCGHTPDYYPPHYARRGFVPSRGDNIAYAVDLEKPSPALDDLARMAERVRARGRFTVRAVDFSRWDAELDRVHELLNTALAHLPDHRPWPRSVVEESLSPFREIADPELVLFVDDERGCTVGWLPGIPDLNEAFIHGNGLRYPWNYARLWLASKRKFECLTVKSVLLEPQYWGSGAVVLLFDEMARRAKARGYRWIDCSLTSLDNPRTPALAERFGAKLYKRYRVYRLDLN